MLLSDFCNRLYVTSTPRMIRFPSLPRSAPRGTASAGIPRRPEPRRDNPGGASLDGDPPASAEVTTLGGSVLGVSLGPRLVVASFGPGGCCDRQPLRTAPPGRGVFDREPSSYLLLWRPLSRPASSGPKPVECGEPDPSSPPSRQSRWIPRARAPSIDQCPLSRARHRSHGFAAASRLQAPLRSSGRFWFPIAVDELDPRIAARAERLWSTSATKTIREHVLRTARSPASSRRLPSSRRRGWVVPPRHGSKDPGRGGTIPAEV